MSATITLRDLAEAREILDEFLAESEGEVTPELEQLLEQLEGQTNEKIERVGLYVREQLLTAAAVKDEEQRLAGRRKALERAAEGLKVYLLAQLRRLDKKKVEGLLCTVARQNNSTPSVTHTLDELTLRALAHQTIVGDGGVTVPSPFQQFVKVIPPTPARYELDAAAVVQAWRAHLELPADVRVELGEHVRIR
jgi:hypothetical protein